MTKCCDLCKLPATTYCQSDRASLCWDCDSKVHGANFLVARHVRGLLCRACQSLTPWRASGSFLGRSTVSLCHTCSPSTEPNNSRRQRSEGKEDREIQAVPFASESVTPPAPTDSSSSSSSSSFASSLSSCFRKEDGEISLKRIRDTSSSSNLLSLLQKGIGGSSSQGQRGSTSEAGGEEEAAATRVEFDSSPRKTKKRMVGENYPLEYRRTGTGAAHSRAGSRCGEKTYKKKDKEAATRKFN